MGHCAGSIHFIGLLHSSEQVFKYPYHAYYKLQPLQHDLTLDIVVLVVFGIICIIGAMYFLMLHIVANVPYSFIVYRALVVCSIVTV